MLDQLRRILLPQSAIAYSRPRSWLVRIGQAGSDSSGPDYQDGEIAVFRSKPVCCDDLRLVGDVWLSNSKKLKQQFSIAETAADLELIAQLWLQKAEACLPLLQGTFCFIVWDSKSRKIKIVRDPVGAKTIYIGRANNVHWISPKLHIAASFCQRTIDTVALRDFLCAAFVPGERTLFQNVRELRPGTIDNLSSSQVYWTVKEDYLNNNDEPLEWHADKLRILLEEVIAEQLPNEEEVGCYLSGGLDSSSVLALARRLHNKPVHCYSIHFGNECPNELEFSSMVAKHCDARHHIIEITPDDMWNMHSEVLSMLDDPIGDPGLSRA